MTRGEGGQFLLTYLCARREHDRRPCPFYQRRVGHGERDGLADRRVPKQRILNLVGRELLAAAVDDLLNPADDDQRAVGGQRAEIACSQPAVDKARLRSWRPCIPI